MKKLEFSDLDKETYKLIVEQGHEYALREVRCGLTDEECEEEGICLSFGDNDDLKYMCNSFMNGAKWVLEMLNISKL